MIQQVPLGLVTPRFPFFGLSFGAVPPTGTEMETRTFGPRLRHRHKPTALSTLTAQGRELFLTLVSPPSGCRITIQASESIFPRSIHERPFGYRLPAPVRLTASVLAQAQAGHSVGHHLVADWAPFAPFPSALLLQGFDATPRHEYGGAGESLHLRRQWTPVSKSTSHWYGHHIPGDLSVWWVCGSYERQSYSPTRYSVALNMLFPFTMLLHLFEEEVLSWIPARLRLSKSSGPCRTQRSISSKISRSVAMDSLGIRCLWR